MAPYTLSFQYEDRNHSTKPWVNILYREFIEDHTGGHWYIDEYILHVLGIKVTVDRDKGRISTFTMQFDAEEDMVAFLLLRS